MTPLYKSVMGNAFTADPEIVVLDLQMMKICNVLFDATVVPFFIVSPAGNRFTYVNAAMCKLLGYPMNELLSIPAKAIISPASLVALCDVIHRSSAKGAEVDGMIKVPVRRVEIFRRDRTILTLDLQCQLTLNSDASVAAISGIGENITVIEKPLRKNTSEPTVPASVNRITPGVNSRSVDSSGTEPYPAGESDYKTPVIPGRILIMDDEDILIDIALQMGKRLGLVVDTVRNCNDAVAMYRKAVDEGDPHDIILLDMTIAGGIGGIETLEALKKVNPEVKAIVMSGFSDHEVMSNPQKYGFSAVITKPFRLNEFSRVLRELLPVGKFIKG